MPILLQNFLAASRKRNIIGFGLLPANYDISFIDDAVISSPPTVSETHAGTIDGVNAVFTLAQAPQVTAGGAVLWLSKNGVLLAESVGFTISGVTITFLAGYIPQAGNVIRATYFI